MRQCRALEKENPKKLPLYSSEPEVGRRVLEKPQRVPIPTQQEHPWLLPSKSPALASGNGPLSGGITA